MEKYLLDSSIIIHILSASEKGVAAIELFDEAELSTSIICYCEVLNKINLEKIAKAQEFLSKLLVFGINTTDGETAIELQYNCRKTGKQVETLDALIAATAINNNAVVISSDKDFERIEGVRKKLF